MMEADPDGPENATETDNLVNYDDITEDAICEDALEELEEKISETSTLLADMPTGQGTSSTTVGELDSRPTTSNNSTNVESKDKPQHPHPYHLKNKYTFRSDSVYSDVIPMSAASHHQQSNNKTSDPREKSGSLSSLKGKQESKWSTLKKKLGKLNSHSHHSHSHSHSQSHHSHGSEKHQTEQKEKERPPANKSLHEKRSLFQRAKTLSILPVHKMSKDKEDVPSQPKRVVEEPPELFNVGGEMNLIPLELLIDVNDLNLRQ